MKKSDISMTMKVTDGTFLISIVKPFRLQLTGQMTEFMKLIHYMKHWLEINKSGGNHENS